MIIEHARPSLAQLVEDREDACPHRDVEHRDRLVRNEQLGLEDEARRDRDPLSLAARELVREPVDEELGGRQPDALERVAPRAALRRARADAVRSRSGSSTVDPTRNRGSSDS